MDRGTFIKKGLLGLMTISSLPDLKKFSDSLGTENEKLPLLFVGHGSPMNAIEDNEFTKGWKLLGKTLPRPKAILCISAHWETRGTFVTAMDKPETIHDFGGFPQALFNVQYPAPGSPLIAKEVANTVKSTQVGLDTDQWGLDHGCWSIIRPMFPDADIPVIQLSLDYTKSPQWHYDLAKELSTLRSKGVLIVGSGNLVHNLGRINWSDPNGIYDWANEFNEKAKSLMLANDHKSLINYSSLGKSASLSIPSPEHYLPLLYILGLKESNEEISFFNDKTIMGSITMTSVLIKKQA
jgi:4,5-DOPA dioxygenase extradiol